MSQQTDTHHTTLRLAEQGFYRGNESGGSLFVQTRPLGNLSNENVSSNIYSSSGDLMRSPDPKVEGTLWTHWGSNPVPFVMGVAYPIATRPPY